MLSKEEIEKIKRGLTEELGRTITASECGLSTNDFSESIEILESALKYIEQLETDKQKLIEKLEEDIVNITKTMQDRKHWDDYSRCRLKAYRTKTKEILKILKGENE